MDTPSDALRTDPILLGKLCRAVNDEAAWSVFLRRYQPAFLAWARGHGLQPADAEDVSQSVLAGLAKSLPTFRYDPSAGSFRGWLRTVVGNAVRNFWRSRARHPADVGSGDSAVADMLREAEDPDGFDDLVTEVDGRIALALRAAEEVRAKVKETTWKAFALYTMDGLPVSEVAAQLGIPVAYVYVYKDRVAKLLRQAIDPPPARPTPEVSP